ncbi:MULTISPECIES: hypothetical protein [unclassified Geodermatophilus]|uniref:hypothetical protein n=1 Tax=unclassified Geodermatophilus TaxID=2637632 RepID=UPI003EEB2D6D
MTAGPRTAARALRIQAHNAQWLELSSVTLLAGLDPAVDPAALRATLRRLYDVDPTAPILCRVAGRPLRWVPVPPEEIDARLEELVVDVRGSGKEDAEEAVERLLREADPMVPFRLYVHDDHHAWQLSHVLGDGIYANRHVVAELVRCAATGEVPTGLVRGPDRPRLLARAVWRTLLRRPQAATWREALDRLRSAPSASVPAGDPADRQVSLSVVSRMSAPGVRESVRHWRDAHAADTSVAVATMSAVRSALEAEGAFAPETDTVVLFDGRRYLPPGTHVAGNFSGALRLAPENAADPRLMARQMRRDAALGLPLVSMLVAMVQHTLSRVRPSHGTGSGSVVLTHLGALGEVRDLPWRAPDAEQKVIQAPAPSPAVSMTACISEWRDRLLLSVSFDSRRVPRAAVTRALDRVLTDPAAFLPSARGHG